MDDDGVWDRWVGVVAVCGAVEGGRKLYAGVGGRGAKGGRGGGGCAFEGVKGKKNRLGDLSGRLSKKLSPCMLLRCWSDSDARVSLTLCA